jgi:outer membrane biosynthesis protein TonB
MSTVKAKAFAWTVAVHLLLLLLFFWLQYAIPVVTNTTEMGMEVNLGNSETGSGTDQPMSPGDPANFSSQVVYESQNDKTPIPDNIHESTDPDAPSLAKPNDAKPSPTNQPTETREEKPIPPAPKYVYGGTGGGTSGNKATEIKKGSGEGITGGPGDQGVPGGTAGATNYTGPIGSGGIGHTLTGRKISPDRFEAEFKEGGTVVVRVTVDKEGNIVDKYVKSSSAPQLTRLALDKLARAKFSKTTGSEPQQFGDVTFVFKTRQ